MRNRNGVTRVTAKPLEKLLVFSKSLDADMDLQSVQATDGEIQTDKKKIEKHWEREGKSETERRDERHNGAI